MRTYYAFIIKDALMHFYLKRPYSLYKILEQIYRLKSNDIVLGYRLLGQVTKPFGIKKIDNFIYKRHFNELEYFRIDDGHMIKNLYSDEITFLKAFNTHVKIKTNNNCSTFFNSIQEYDENIFVCDFENQDFFWINKFDFESIV